MCFSSQVLFSISQKLIQHQIYNYTEILKWLREILICRNHFLQKHKDYAYVGSNIRICRQAHIKLEVQLLDKTRANRRVVKCLGSGFLAKSVYPQKVGPTVSLLHRKLRKPPPSEL